MVMVFQHMLNHLMITRVFAVNKLENLLENEFPDDVDFEKFLCER